MASYGSIPVLTVDHVLNEEFSRPNGLIQLCTVIESWRVSYWQCEHHIPILKSGLFHCSPSHCCQNGMQHSHALWSAWNMIIGVCQSGTVKGSWGTNTGIQTDVGWIWLEKRESDESVGILCPLIPASIITFNAFWWVPPKLYDFSPPGRNMAP